MNAQATHVKAPDRSVICRVDLVLLLIVIFSCGVLVAIANRVVAWSHRYDEPLKEEFDHAAGVPFSQAQLSIAEADLKAFANKLMEQQMETARLASEIEAEAKNPPSLAKKKSAAEDVLRDQRVKLATATAMARLVDAEIPKKMQRVAESSAAAFKARHTADINFRKAREKDERSKKTEMLTWVGLSSIVLFIVAWFGCGWAHRSVGTGRRPIVLVPAVVFLLTMGVYEVLK